MDTGQPTHSLVCGVLACYRLYSTYCVQISCSDAHPYVEAPHQSLHVVYTCIVKLPLTCYQFFRTIDHMRTTKNASGSDTVYDKG